MIRKAEVFKFIFYMLCGFIIGVEVGFILDSGDFFNRYGN